MAKAKAEFKLVEAQRARQNLIAFYRCRIYTELKEDLQDNEEYFENTDTFASAVNKGPIMKKTSVLLQVATLLNPVISCLILKKRNTTRLSPTRKYQMEGYFWLLRLDQRKQTR